MSEPTVVYEIPLGRYQIETRQTYWTPTLAGTDRQTAGEWEQIDRANTFEEAKRIAHEYADENRFQEVRVTDTQPPPPDDPSYEDLDDAWKQVEQHIGMENPSAMASILRHGLQAWVAGGMVDIDDEGDNEN